MHLGHPDPYIELALRAKQLGKTPSDLLRSMLDASREYSLTQEQKEKLALSLEEANKGESSDGGKVVREIREKYGW